MASGGVVYIQRATLLQIGQCGGTDKVIMTIRNHKYNIIDFGFAELRLASVLRLPRPHGERRTDDPGEIGRGARRSKNQFIPPWG
jgi:hypothetical protein